MSSNFNILINSLFFNQIPTFWSIPTFAIKYTHLIDLPFSLKFQHFDQFPHFHSNFNILIDLKISIQITAFWLIPNFKSSNFNVFIDSPLSLIFGHFDQSQSPFSRISTFWSTWHFALKFQHYDRFPTLSLNFNILINSLFFNQIPIFWLISTFAVKYQHLINLRFFAQISTFWSIWHLAFKFDQSPLYTQISTFWLIPNFSLEFQHF